MKAIQQLLHFRSSENCTCVASWFFLQNKLFQVKNKHWLAALRLAEY